MIALGLDSLFDVLGYRLAEPAPYFADERQQCEEDRDADEQAAFGGELQVVVVSLLEVLSREEVTAAPEVAEELQVAVGVSVLRIEGGRSRERPFKYQIAYLAPSVAARLDPAMDLSHSSIIAQASSPSFSQPANSAASSGVKT